MGIKLQAMRALFVFVLLLFCSAAWSQSLDQPSPTLSGYVTRVASASDFDVNGIRVLCGPDTHIQTPSGDGYYPGCFSAPPIFGQLVDVYGHRKKSLHAITADRIDVKRIHHEDISGYAVIDAVEGPSNLVAGGLEFRADGYRMLLTPQTRVSFETPLNGASDIMTNVWVDFDGKARPDGTFILRAAKFSQNMISEREGTMRAKTDYDPSSVAADARPNRATIAVGLGVDPKRIPPWPNREAQERIENIGAKLVPAWQTGLDAADPSRINFRFQVTDGKRWPWVLALPSGVILVPHEIVERMENDSQLAEILADAIAGVLEKQKYRMHVAGAVVTGGNIASWAALVPVVGTPIALANIGTGTTAAVMQRKEEHQSERVSLCLMHDAGYDVDEAPVAWWLLSSRKPKAVDQIPLPERSAFLYRTLAEVWSSGGAAAGQ